MSLSMLAGPIRPAARSRLRPRRRRASHLFAAALVALAAAGPIAPPAQAQDGVDYLLCVETVVEWTDACYARNNIIGDVGCTILGVAGILACAAAEAIEKLGGGVRLS